MYIYIYIHTCDSTRTSVQLSRIRCRKEAQWEQGADPESDRARGPESQRAREPESQGARDQVSEISPTWLTERGGERERDRERERHRQTERQTDDLRYAKVPNKFRNAALWADHQT